MKVRILPGPMEGVMSPLFCAVAAQLDLLPEMITPFLRISQDLPRIGKMRKWLKPLTIPNKPLTVQLMGDDPINLQRTVQLLHKEGVKSFNLNFACPSSKVLRSGAGGALLKNPELMRRIISGIRENVPEVLLSVKLRVGFASADELPSIVAAFDDLNLDFMAVHFRTVDEGYRRVSDGLERLKRAVELSSVPVIGNGDILTSDDASRMLENSGCAGVMCARGLLRDPFLLKRLSEKVDITPAAGRLIFYNRALDLASSYPELYWSKPQLLEMARFVWGTSSKQFQRIVKLDNFSVGNIRKSIL